MTKNHPFLNGNKRLAVTTMLNFLAKNGKWIKASPIALYEIAKLVAKSKPHQKDDMVAAFKMFLDDNLIPFQPSR